MHSFDVYIVDVAQKLQKLKFFAFFAQIVLKRYFCNFDTHIAKKNLENGSYELEMISAFREMCFWSSVTLQS